MVRRRVNKRRMSRMSRMVRQRSGKRYSWMRPYKHNCRHVSGSDSQGRDSRKWLCPEAQRVRIEARNPYQSAPTE